MKDNNKTGEKPGRTEIVFILDGSGSMGGLEDDTIGGFNTLLEKNRNEPGEATVSTIVFSDDSRVLHDRLDIREVPPLTRADYGCYGCTALLDAVGGAIKHVDLVQSVQPEGFEAEKVLFIITTDGMENSSRRYRYPEVKAMIEKHREKGWEFLFIGANIDAGAEAEQLGIERDRAADYLADEQGTEVLYSAMASAVASVRSAPTGGVLGNTWREGLDEDIRTRR